MATTASNLQGLLYTETEAREVRRRNDRLIQSEGHDRESRRQQIEDPQLARSLGVRVADLY